MVDDPNQIVEQARDTLRKQGAVMDKTEPLSSICSALFFGARIANPGMPLYYTSTEGEYKIRFDRSVGRINLTERMLTESLLRIDPHIIFLRAAMEPDCYAVIIGVKPE